MARSNRPRARCYTVMRELGHRSYSLIETRYGHVLKQPRRTEDLAFPEPEIVIDEE